MMIHFSQLLLSAVTLVGLLQVSAVEIDDNVDQMTHRHRHHQHHHPHLRHEYDRILLSDAFFQSTATAPFLANSSCISTDRQIRDAVKLAPNPTASTKPLLINVCRPLVVIDGTKKENGISGINLSNRYIDLRCQLSVPHQRCVLNGNGKSRIFYGNNTKLIVTGIDFVNASSKGKDSDPIRIGSALTFDKKSSITLNQCFLNNNVGYEASAISIAGKSNLILKGSNSANPMIITKNKADNFGAIKMSYSTLTATNVIISNNRADPWDVGAMLLDYSKATMENVSFTNNVATEWTGTMLARNSILSMWNVQVKSSKAGIYGTMRLVKTNATFSRCQFMNNTIEQGALLSDQSKINLSSCTFYKNDGYRVGADITIEDNIEPKLGGSYVSCDGNKNIFCDGIGNIEISNAPRINNTNCKTKGIVGKPGVSPCIL